MPISHEHSGRMQSGGCISQNRVRWQPGGSKELCRGRTEDPELKLRDWPMFQVSPGRRKHRSTSPVSEGHAPPHISELIMALVPGGPSEKLSWLRQQIAAGKLDGDDPDEIVEAEALLGTLMRMAGSKGGRERRHLEE